MVSVTIDQPGEMSPVFQENARDPRGRNSAARTTTLTNLENLNEQPSKLFSAQMQDHFHPDDHSSEPFSLPDLRRFVHLYLLLLLLSL